MRKTLKTILQYTAAIALSLLVALALRLFVIDFYSMPKRLHVGIHCDFDCPDFVYRVFSRFLFFRFELQ